MKRKISLKYNAWLKITNHLITLKKKMFKYFSRNININNKIGRQGISYYRINDLIIISYIFREYDFVIKEARENLE